MARTGGFFSTETLDDLNRQAVVTLDENGDIKLLPRITAKEIAAGTGLSLSHVYRCLKSLERKGLIRKITGVPVRINKNG
jgi:uncharacterized membrane protein